MIKKLLSVSPRVEVMLKRLAYSSDGMKKLVKKVYYKLSGGEKKIEKSREAFEKLCQRIDTLGIEKGDILIVHSSMDGLSAVDASPMEYINYLLGLVGDEGTLVFPAFPSLNRPDLFPRNMEEIPTYIPARTPSWTGLLPNVFCMYPGVKRSEFPYNSLAAKGKYAEEMMKDNLKAQCPHGKDTPWEFCVEHHAKVLFLGVEMERSNTLLHVAEDYMGEEWPIKDWYDRHVYKVKLRDGTVVEKEFFACKHSWTGYSAIHCTIARLKKRDLLREVNTEQVALGFVPDAKKLVDAVIQDTKNGKLRYVVPKKYLKKK
ncbi:MAG: AAC(3) family N-acetyltransferase [Ruminococcaceae bacterium]|nr:AAC(3) family N-acetyltransferase [Oscillospiraceae bacterium]